MGDNPFRFYKKIGLDHRFGHFRHQKKSGYNGFWGERITAAKQQGIVAWGFNPRKGHK
jgi:hypothetical protein